MPFNLEKAKSRLVEVLQEEYEHQGDAPERVREQLREEGADDDLIDTILGNRIYVRKNSPYIINVGSRQVVLRLGHGAAAKLIRPEGEQALDDWHVINTRRGYPRDMFSVDDVLIELNAAHNLGYDVPAHHYLRLERENGRTTGIVPVPPEKNSAHTVITRDLTEDGDKSIQELNIDQFMVLENGQEILNQYAGIARFFLDMHDHYQAYKRGAGPKPAYGIEATAHKSHAPDAHPQVAINRMLLVQIDPKTDTGKLVCGDLDHLRVWRME